MRRGQRALLHARSAGRLKLIVSQSDNARSGVKSVPIIYLPNSEFMFHLVHPTAFVYVGKGVMLDQLLMIICE